MFRKFSIMALAGSLALCGAAPISAQDAGFEITGATDTIEVEAKQAVTLAFDDAYAELSVGDPEIADISSLSGTLVYLLGKEVGETTLTVIRDRDSLDLTHMTVVVYRDIAPMQGFLEKAGGDVTLERAGVVVTASGCVAGDRQRQALEGVMTQLKSWGYVALADVGAC